MKLKNHTYTSRRSQLLSDRILTLFSEAGIKTLSPFFKL